MKKINITLDENEAWVLFEFLNRFSDTDKLNIEDPAEKQALWNLCCAFEKKCATTKMNHTKSSLKNVKVV